MEGALAWIGQLAEWIGKFFPRWALLDSTEGAVKFTGFLLPRHLRLKFGGYDGDLRVTVHGPGIHWYWPTVSSWQAYPTAFQTDDLPSQTVETADGVTITVSGMISYSISDLGKLLPRTHSVVKAVQVLSMTTIHGVVCKMKWEDLREKQRRGTLKTDLRNAARKELAEFGIEIEDCMLTDLVRTRAYRLISSTQADNQ